MPQPPRPGESKQIPQITTAKKRRKPLGKQFKETFFEADAKEAAQHSILTVVVPSIKDLFAEGLKDAIDHLFFGSTRKANRAQQTQGPNLGTISNYTAYNQVANASKAVTRAISDRARAVHDFDEIVLDSRVAALSVLELMGEAIDKYGSVSVGDLYLMVGLPANHVDETWGWRSIRGSGVKRIHTDGYILNLPAPERLGT